MLILEVFSQQGLKIRSSTSRSWNYRLLVPNCICQETICFLLTKSFLHAFDWLQPFPSFHVASGFPRSLAPWQIQKKAQNHDL